MNGKNVLVIGAAGALGTLICDEVQKYAPELTLFLGDYRPERGRALALRFGPFRQLPDRHIPATSERAPFARALCGAS